MTDPVPDRKRAHSAVDPSSLAAAEDDREPMVIEDKRQRLQEEIATMRTGSACGGDENILRTSHQIRRTSVCHARASCSESSAIDGSTSLSAAGTRCAVSSRSSQVQRISMPPLPCHARLRPSSSVRNEKGTRCALGTAQMRFCRATCWKRSTLNPQQKPRSLQMLYGGSTRLFQVSKEAQLHGELASMGSWVALLWTSGALWLLWTNSTTGVRNAVQAVMKHLERVAKLKIVGVLDQFGKQTRFLGSFITRVRGGHTIQTDTEILLAGLRGLNLEHCKPSKLPGATPRTHDLTPLDPPEHKLYRRVVGGFLYCNAHRGDFAFTLNQLCRRVQSPTVSDVQALRKLARCIKWTLHYKLSTRPRHGSDLKIEAYTGADWAGQPDRHSITGGLLLVDSVNVSSWARTQKAIATSSGESELYAMSAGAAEALGFRELLTDIGLPATIPLRSDSTAAMSAATRQGLGRMKHVQVRDLALQQWIADGLLTLQKVASAANAADLLTKHVSQNVRAPVSRPEARPSAVTTKQRAC